MDAQIINGQIADFAYKLEKSISGYVHGMSPSNRFETILFKFIEETKNNNPWFLSEHLVFAFRLLIANLIRLPDFLNSNESSDKKIAVLLRTNAPLEGIIEIIYLLLQGYSLQVQTQPELKKYIKDLFELLSDIPTLSENVEITDGKFENINALIAMAPLTNTAIEYFTKFPSLQLYTEGCSYIIEENEIVNEIGLLADNCCMFFGRSAMNVKILFVSQNFNEITLKQIFDKYTEQLFHNRYFNNYEYRKSVLIINRIPFMEAGPLLITEDERQAGYTGVLVVKKYTNILSVDNDKLITRFPIVTSAMKSESKLPQLSTFDLNITKIATFLKTIV